MAPSHFVDDECYIRVVVVDNVVVVVGVIVVI